MLVACEVVEVMLYALMCSGACFLCSLHGARCLAGNADTPLATLATAPHQKVVCCCDARLALAQQLRVLLSKIQSAASFPYLLCCLLALHHVIMLLYRLEGFLDLLRTR